MVKIVDRIFGNLFFDGFWKRDYSFLFLSKDYQIQILIEGDEDVEIEDLQRIAFEELEKEKEKLFCDAENAIFSYYQSICLDCRKRATTTNLANIKAPLVSTKEELQNLVQPQSLFFPEVFEEGKPVFGLLLTCTWEPEHGLAVKFLNSRVTEVGFQDIIL